VSLDAPAEGALPIGWDALGGFDRWEDCSDEGKGFEEFHGVFRSDGDDAGVTRTWMALRRPFTREPSQTVFLFGQTVVTIDYGTTGYRESNGRRLISR